MPLTMLQDDVPLAKLQKISDIDIEEDKELQKFVRELSELAKTTVSSMTEEPPADGTVGSLCTNFRHMVTEEMLKMIENQTNFYSMQKAGVEISTAIKEIEMFIGIYLQMGLVKIPRV